MPEQTKKKQRIHPIDKLVAILLISVVVGVIAYYSYQSASSTTSTSSRVQPYAIPFDYFHLTNTTGCLKQEGMQTYEYYVVTITNRSNETVHYINASIELGDVEFMNYNYPDVTGPLVLFQAGPNDTVTWTFPIYFPMSGIAYGTYYEGTNVRLAIFDVVIYIKEANQLLGPIFVGSDLGASYLAPRC